MNQEEAREFFLDNFKTIEGQKYEVPPEGSLGLLALGDLGLIAWRIKKQKEHNTNPEHKLVIRDDKTEE